MNRVPWICEVAGEQLVGTLHTPQERDAAHIGVLLLNAGPAPRAGNSDLSVHIADRLAARGFICARFDLVGLGDSTGESLPTLDEYWRGVLEGRNDRPTSALVAQMRSRLALDGIVIGGLCAGAVSALRAAHASSQGVAGLILLEPNFRTAPDTGPHAQADVTVYLPAQAPGTKLRRALSMREWLYALTGESRWARLFRPLGPFFERLLEQHVGHTLPRDANVSLIMRWRHMLERRLPTFVATTQSHLSEKYYRRIMCTLPDACGGAVDDICVPGTNHIMTTGDARRIVCDAVESWMVKHFDPSTRPSSRTARSAQPRPVAAAAGR